MRRPYDKKKVIRARLLCALVAASCAAGAALVAPSTARADEDEPIVGSMADVRAPVRGGWGYSSLYHSRVGSWSFEDEVSLWKIAERLRAQLLFGMDAVEAPTLELPGHDPRKQGYLAVALGAGVAARLGKPLAVLSGTMGPLFEDDPTNDFALHGFGVSARLEVFPYYPSLRECALCEHGILGSYVLSGLHAWVLGRQDWLGDRNGTTFAFGIGLDLGRNVLLPVLG